MTGKILVCDDDADIRDVVSIILKNNGYKVKILSSGRDIKKVVEEYKPDAILLDLMMPEVNGMEVTRTLKKYSKTKNIPLLVFSAVNNGHEIAREIGADGFIPKPFDMKALLAKVKSVLKVESSF